MSEIERLEARLRVLATAPEVGADWDDVLNRAGERFSSRPLGRRRLGLALAVVVSVAVAASAAVLFAASGTRPRPPGSAGATGQNGLTGVEGATGHRGATGHIGVTGAAPGPSGTVGPTGFPFPSSSRIVFGPVGLSANELKAKARTLGAPIYWAGPVEGDKYELTRTRLGRIFLRYLPDGVSVGTPGGNFLVVATSPQPGAFEILTHQAGGGILSGPDGSVIDADTNDPNKVLLAFPHVDEQIEIYDLRPGKALAIAKSGDIRPVG